MKQKWVLNLTLAMLVAAALCVSTAGSVKAKTGGPETSGYVFVDSDEAGGPNYTNDFVDITTTGGTALTKPTADNMVFGPFPLGFTFHFFDQDYTELYISDNGYISFLNQASNPSPVAIPSANAPNALVAAWWGDLKFEISGSITYQLTGTENNHVFIIEYKDLPYSLIDSINPYAAKTTFEIKLFEATGAVEVLYASAPVNSDSDGNPIPSTAGIQNQAGELGLQYYYGVDGLAANLAVLYTPFVGVALEPASIIGYGRPGDLKTYTLTVYNWTGTAATFSINTTSSSWISSPPPATTGSVDQGKAAAFTLGVTIPTGAGPGTSDEVTITVSDGGSYSDTTTIISAVPQVGYIGTENSVLFFDTQFHQDLGNPLDLEPVAPFANGLALSPDGSLLYVVLGGGEERDAQGNVIGSVPGQLLAYDTQTLFQGLFDTQIVRDPIDSVVIGYDSSDVALSLNGTLGGQYALVSSNGDGTVLVIDSDPNSPSFLQTAKSIQVGSNPVRIATSPCLDKAYVTNRGSNSVSVIDLDVDPAAIAIFTTISGLNGPWGIEVSPSGDRAYVVNNSNGRLGVIDTVNDTLLTTWDIAGSSPEDLDASQDGNHLYVGDTASILDVNPSSGAVARTIPNPANGIFSIELFPSHPLAYTANGSERTISVLDTGLGAIIQSIQVSGAPAAMALFPPSTTCDFPPIAAFRPNPLVGQVGVAFAFTGASIRNPTSYDWDFGDGSSHSAAENPTHTYTSAGPFTVILTANKDGYASNSISRTINFKPKASFSPSLSKIKVGDAVNFTDASNPGTSAASYHWDFGDGGTSSAQNPSHTYTTIGNFTVTETVTNSYGSDTATGQVVFPAIAAFTPGATVIQTGDSIAFTNTSTGTSPLTYAWEFGDGTTSTDTSPSHAFNLAVNSTTPCASSGSCTVKLTVTNAWSDPQAPSTATATINFKPRAGFTPGQTTIQVGDTVSFTNTSTGNETLDYAWNIGDGATSIEKNPQHQYLTAGNYPVTLTVSNSYGSDTATGQVNFPAKAAFTPSATVIQTGDSITFTNTSTGSTPLSYSWDFGDGSPASTDVSPVHTYLTAGDYTVTLTARNDWGDATTATSTVRFRPKAAFSPTDALIRLGDATTFTNQSTGSPSLSYLWDFGDGATSTEVNPTHVYSSADQHTVTLTATNSLDSDTVSGTVTFRPVAGFTPAQIYIDAGESVTFTNTSSGTGPLSYAWDFGDGATSSEKNPVHAYPTVGNYQVRLTVTHAANGSDTADGQVLFNPKASFSPVDPVIHLGESIAFSNTSTGSTPLSYLWDFGDGTTSTAIHPTHAFTQVTTYPITLTVTNNSGKPSTATTTVNFAPVADFSFPTDHEIQVGEDVPFANLSTGSGTLSYAWDFGDGSTSTDPAPVHVYSRRNIFTVKLTVQNAFGTAEASRFILVNPYRVELVLSVDDGIDRIQPGGRITYTMVLTNNGPDDLVGGTVQDQLPNELTHASWTCTATDGSACPSEGSGNLIEDEVIILKNGSLTYTLTATVSAAAGTTFGNTVRIVLPSGYLSVGSPGGMATHQTIVLPMLYLPIVKR